MPTAQTLLPLPAIDRNAYTNRNRNSDTDCNAYNNLDPDDHANSDFNTYGHTEAYSDPKG